MKADSNLHNEHGQARGADLGSIETLNLHGNCIRKLEWLDGLRHLRVLILCFNEIHKALISPNYEWIES